MKVAQQKGEGCRKGTELRGLYSPLKRGEVEVGVISEGWPVWLSVLPALGIKKAVSWGSEQSLNMNTYFSEEFPGLRFVSSKKKVITRKLDVVFVSGSPRFVNETCSCLEGQRIWATCSALRGKRLGVLGEVGLQWKHVNHAEVGGVTNGGFWVGSNFGAEGWAPACERDVLSSVEDGLPFVKPPRDILERPTGVRTVVRLGKLLSENSLQPIGE
jgi:hypothetical protein